MSARLHALVPSGLRRALFFVFLAGIALPVGAEDAGPRAVGPEINAYYATPDFERWRQTFERPGREVYDRRQEIVAAIRLKAGMTVADVGAGTGLFTLLFGQEVGPEGRVVAVDISPGFIENVLHRAAAEGLQNVRGLVSSQHSTLLEPSSLDLVFVCDTYHHFEYPRAMLGSIRQALRPGGELIIIDFRRDPRVNSPWVLGHVRSGRDQVVGEVTEAGLILVEELDILRESFYLRFRNPPAADL